MLELILCIIESSLDKKKREAAKALSFIFAEKFFLRETDYFGIEQKHGSSSTNAFAFLLCFLLQVELLVNFTILGKNQVKLCCCCL